MQTSHCVLPMQYGYRHTSSFISYRICIKARLGLQGEVVSPVGAAAAGGVGCGREAGLAGPLTVHVWLVGDRRTLQHNGKERTSQPRERDRVCVYNLGGQKGILYVI